MGDCVISGESSKCICAPCKLRFCTKHKVVHEKRNIRDIRLMNPGNIVSALAQDYQIFLKAHTTQVEGFVIAYNKKYIISVACESKDIIVWNFESYRQEAILQGNNKKVTCIDTTRESEYIISGSDDKTIRIWSFPTGIQESVLEGHDKSVNSIAITRDCKYIISTDYSTIRIWNFQQKVQEFIINDIGYADSIGFFCIPDKVISIISKDERYLIYPIIEGIVVWNFQERCQERILIKDKIDSDFPFMIVLTTDNQFIIAGYKSGCIRIWNRESYEKEIVLEGHDDVVLFLFITSDNKYIVSGCNDIRIWNFHLKTLATVLSPDCPLIIVEMTNDYRYIIYALEDYSIRVWGFQEEQQVAILRGHTTEITYIGISNDNDRMVTGSNGHTVRVWSLKQKRLLCTLPGHVKKITSIAITRDQKYIVSGSFDRTVRIWNVKEKTQETVLVGHKRHVTCVGLTNDDKYAISGSNDKTVRIWRLQGKELGAGIGISKDALGPEIKRHSYRYIASGSEDKTAKKWALQKWQMNRKGAVIKVGVKGMKSITFALSGKFIVSGLDDNTLRVWKLNHSLKKLLLIE